MEAGEYTMRNDQVNREETGLINESLAFLANFGCRHPWIVLIGTVVTCAASLVTSFCQLKYHTQRNDMISPSKDYLQRWQQYITEFGDDDDMVVVVEGKDRPHMEQALEDLAQQVSDQPDLFDRLFYKVDLRSLNNRKLLLLPDDQIEKIQAGLDNFWPLLNIPVLGAVDRTFTWKLLGLRHIIDDARMRVAKIKESGSEDDFDPAVRRDLSGGGRVSARPGLVPQSLARLHPPGRPRRLSGKGEVLLLRRRHPGDAAGPADEGKGRLHLRPEEHRRPARHSRPNTETRYPDMKFGLTGLPVLENDEMIASQNDSNTPPGWP